MVGIFHCTRATPYFHGTTSLDPGSRTPCSMLRRHHRSTAMAASSNQIHIRSTSDCCSAHKAYSIGAYSRLLHASAIAEVFGQRTPASPPTVGGPLVQLSKIVPHRPT